MQFDTSLLMPEEARTGKVYFTVKAQIPNPTMTDVAPGEGVDLDEKARMGAALSEHMAELYKAKLQSADASKLDPFMRNFMEKTVREREKMAAAGEGQGKQGGCTCDRAGLRCCGI